MKKLLALLALLFAAPLFAQPVITDSTGRLKTLQAQIDILYAKIVTGNLGLANGGTNANLSATGGTSFVLRQSSVGAAVTVSQLAASDLSNGTTGSGVAVLAVTPTLIAPVLGAATATSLTASGTVSGASVTASGTATAATLNVSGIASAATVNVSGLTASQAVLTDGSKNLSSVGTTGTGSVVLATSPVLVTPTLGAATAATVNKLTITAPATSATLTVADGKTALFSNTLALGGTDSTVMTFPSTSATVARTDAGQTFAGTNTFSGATAFSSTLNKVTLTPPAVGSTLTIADGKTLTATNSITLTGTDTTVMTFPTVSSTLARVSGANTFTAPQTITTTTVTPFTVTRPTAGVGTVSSGAGGSSLIGSGTTFFGYIQIGDVVTLSNAEFKTVSAVGNDTSLTVTGTWIATCNACTYSVGALNPIAISDNGVSFGGGTPTVATPFRVFTGGVEHLSIGSSGAAVITGTTNVPFASLSSLGTGTGFNVFAINNFAGSTYWGLEGSLGGVLFTGAVAYSSVLGSTGATPLHLATSSVVRATIDAAGNFAIGGTPVFPFHVINAGANQQIVSEFNFTHRSALWHDAANGYVGTITNTPFRIRTNSLDSMFFGIDQSVGIGAAPITPRALTVARDLTTTTYNNAQIGIHGLTTTAKQLGIGYDTVAGRGFMQAAEAAAGFKDLWLESEGGSTLFGGTGQQTSVAFTGLVTTYAGAATASRGVPAILGSVTLAAQTAAITTTNLLSAPPAGMYRVCYYHEITVAATTSSATQLTLAWTGAAAQTATGVNLNGNVVGQNTTNFAGATPSCIAIRVVSGSVTYAATYSTTGGTAMQFGLNISAERLQ